MRLKKKSLKYTPSYFWITLFFIAGNLYAQDIPSGQPFEIVAEQGEAKEAKDTAKEKMKPFRLDGVAAVVGDFVILESEVDRTMEEINNQSQGSVDITRCQMLGQLLETKLSTHHAIQDSLVVPDSQIFGEVDQVLSRVTAQLGDTDRVLEFYKKDNIADLRAEIFQIRKDQNLSLLMNEKVIENIDVTPDEVRQFFNKIPQEELPTVGVELEIAQIVIRPKASETSKQKAINELNKYRADILENGSSFATKAVLYTDDAASRPDGGFMRINRKSALVKEFRDVVFGLQEGEVSEPFETEYGYHIATLEKTKGQDLEIRHILLIPEIGKAEEEEARDKIELIRKRLKDGELEFGEAAKEFSDEKETKFEDGVLINPQTLERKFELNRLDPILYDKVSNLKEGDISIVFNDPDRTGKTNYKILTVKNRYDEHKVDFVQDYVRVKELALREKQINAVQKWRNKKIIDTYIKVNGGNKDCEFINKWVKK